MLHPVKHRGEEAQADLMKIRVRDGLVNARTKLVNMTRGLAKSVGERVPTCDADNINCEKLAAMPEGLKEMLTPLVKTVGKTDEKGTGVRQGDRADRPDQVSGNQQLMQISGVGPMIALTFVLTVEDPSRFSKSRDVGSYVGLRPRRSDSGQRQPELPITKEGDVYLRRMLVQGAHYILSHRGPDSDLTRWGEKLAGLGKKNAKKRAVVAVARKLAILFAPTVGKW